MMTESAVCMVGVGTGAATATGIYFFARALRRTTPIAATITGCVLGVLLALFTVLMGISAFWAHLHPDPHISVDMSLLLGSIAGVSLFFLLLCAGLALLHSRSFSIIWRKAFAVVMIEVAIALGVSLLLQESLYPIADILRGGNRDIPVILQSYDVTRQMLGALESTLAIVLVALESLIPLTIKLRSLMKRLHTT